MNEIQKLQSEVSELRSELELDKMHYQVHDYQSPINLPTYDQGEWAYSCCGQPAMFHHCEDSNCIKILDDWDDPNNKPSNIVACPSCFGICSIFPDAEGDTSMEVGCFVRGEYRRASWRGWDPEALKKYIESKSPEVYRVRNRKSLNWSLESDISQLKRADDLLLGKFDGLYVDSNNQFISENMLDVLDKYHYREMFLASMQMRSLNTVIALSIEVGNMKTSMQNAGYQLMC